MVNIVQAFVLVCVLASALGVKDTPCNNAHTDCDASECCATISTAEEGYKGSCQSYQLIGEHCTFGGPKEGECGCGPASLCIGFSIDKNEPVVGMCQIILPGRK